jgi:Protein of unknown function (DUF2950)
VKKLNTPIHVLSRALLAFVTLAATMGLVSTALAQQAFPSPEAATEALVTGIATNDDVVVRAVLGANYRRFIPAEGASDEYRLDFLEAWSRSHKVLTDGDRAKIEVGRHGWTLPIPLVKSAASWKFDVAAAPEQMRLRRIGRNELAAIQVTLAYTDAQDEYLAANPERQAVKHYAMRSLSSPGKRDGLYWPALPDEAESPLGAAFADARDGMAYHGYRYRVLTAQGKDAPGGTKNYVRDGLMTEGYALIAWPERWGDTGVMSFIVSRDGVVYQKNLGPGTDAAARKVTAYNPDSTWDRVEATK